MVSREFGLVGRGIGHSFSADFFNSKFAREGIDARYSLFDMQHIDALPDLIAARPLLRGLNVTSPFKRDVIPFLDSLSEEARELQAVNVIEIVRDSLGGAPLLRGHNTDCRGFEMTLDSLPLPSDPEDVTALVLGSGGAASAVALALRRRKIPYRVVSRKPSGNMIGYGEANGMLPEVDLVINATPLGMHPSLDATPPLDFDAIGQRHICYDLIYNPPLTRFLNQASDKGATVKNGLDMLLNQAELSWEIWNKEVG